MPMFRMRREISILRAGAGVGVEAGVAAGVAGQVAVEVEETKKSSFNFVRSCRDVYPP